MNNADDKQTVAGNGSVSSSGTRVPELLAPAGSPEKLDYALAYGADAVYAGIPRFSLRARENPFKDATLKEAIERTHRMGRKIYITANILPPNRKIDSFKQSLAFYADAQPDAFIMADPGMIRFARREFPHVPVHLSVQTNTINYESVQFWYDEGVSRIILSRELSLPEIAEIHEKVPGMELESFVHGAICIAYSGRCLLSNYFNHRDANQGTCTNSCRWEYNVHQQPHESAPVQSTHQPEILNGEYFLEERERPGELMPIDEDEHGTYIMNSKDLRAIEYLKPIHDAGVCSFKIEGRTKTIYYLSMVVRSYRRAIDDLARGKGFDPKLIDEINKTANRGFTSAFLVPRSDHQTERFDSAQETDLPQVFAGQVVDARPGWMEVEVKNRIEVGDRVEYISPARQSYFHIAAIENAKGEAVNVAHGGAGKVWIATDQTVEPYALLSRVVTQQAADAFSLHTQ
ncbi:MULTISPECIES: prephenate-dependent tRNA uridine(34) hydroxylase TrhP [unclassified Nitrospina]|uniref:prephenate-dependent tRNA uridine(34) hydroxylase TrhP n=1 Tax=unclassified Nitrospina TaxID=2638683 RepID=UPI003F957115